jgi:hypothetical protein
VYPVKVTVHAIDGDAANFFVQVGQPGAANKTEFCKGNAILDQATEVAQSPADLIPIFESNAGTILDFERPHHRRSWPRRASSSRRPETR